MTDQASTVDGFGFLTRKFFGGCEVDGKSQKLECRGGLRHAFFYQQPCKIVVKKKAFGDVLIAGGIPSSLFISDELLDVFREAEITGFEVAEADVRIPFPHEPSQAKFWQVIVTGWGGIANPASGIVELDRETYGTHKYAPCTDVRMMLDPEQYDGTDLFLVWPLPYKVWVSPRLSKLLASKRVKHYEIDPVESYRFERLESDPVGFGPYPLECYFTAARAAEVGSAHGIDWFDYSKPPYSRG
ncbi:MAG: hypothetical protein AAF989_12715 [Planctomycetota bacterium]